MLLTVLFTMFKIVGLILLCFIAFILFAVLLVLFVPFSYKIDARKHEAIKGTAVISWLFGMIRAVYEFEDTKGRPSIKLFGITIWREKGAREKSGKKVDKYKEENTAIRKIQEEAGSVSGQAVGSNTHAANTEQSKTNQADNRKQAYEEQRTKQPKEPHVVESGKNKKIKKEKKRGNENGGLDTLKKLWVYENKSEILKQALLLIKRLIKAVLNVRVWAELKIGTGQPHTTGYIIGLCCSVAGFAGLDINAEGDFENKTLLGDAAIKGRIFICSIVWAVLLFIFNKNIFPIFKKVVFQKG